MKMIKRLLDEFELAVRANDDLRIGELLDDIRYFGRKSKDVVIIDEDCDIEFNQKELDTLIFTGSVLDVFYVKLGSYTKFNRVYFLLAPFICEEDLFLGADINKLYVFGSWNGDFSRAKRIGEYNFHCDSVLLSTGPYDGTNKYLHINNLTSEIADRHSRTLKYGFYTDYIDGYRCIAVDGVLYTVYGEGKDTIHIPSNIVCLMPDALSDINCRKIILPEHLINEFYVFFLGSATGKIIEGMFDSFPSYILKYAKAVSAYLEADGEYAVDLISSNYLLFMFLVENGLISNECREKMLSYAVENKLVEEIAVIMEIGL